MNCCVQKGDWVMWFTRRRKRNGFPGRRSKAPEISEASTESADKENTAAADPRAEKPTETDSQAEKPAETDPRAEKPTIANPQQENLTETNPSRGNLSDEIPQRESQTEAEMAGEPAEDVFSRKAEDEETGECTGEEEQKECTEPEKCGGGLGERTTASDSTEEVCETPHRSLYEWRREKRTGARKPAKTVKKTVSLRNGVILGEGLPKICVSVTGESREEIEKQARKIDAEKPDLVEWRADYFRDLDDLEKVTEVLMSLQDILGDTPILFTIRSKREGGKGKLTAEKYRSVILYAAGRPEVSLIDIEGLNPEINVELLISRVHELGMPVIASWHNFGKTPKKPELGLIFDRLERTGADILKVAVMPKKPKDVLRLMSVTEEKNRQISCPLVTMAMGDLGRISRVSGRMTGSAMTFGTVGEASAPGQLPVSDLKRIMKMI